MALSLHFLQVLTLNELSLRKNQDHEQNVPTTTCVRNPVLDEMGDLHST